MARRHWVAAMVGCGHRGSRKGRIGGAVSEALESRQLLTAELGNGRLHLADAVEQMQPVGDGSNDLFIVSTTGGYSRWSDSTTPIRYHLSRIHARGQVVWTRSFSDWVGRIVPDVSGGVWTWSSESSSTHMMYFDARGRTTVDQPYEEPYADRPEEQWDFYHRDVVNHQNQLLEVTGNWVSDDHHELLRIFDSGGNLTASRSLDSLGLKCISSIAVASDDSVYLGGTPAEMGGPCIVRMTGADTLSYIPAPDQADGAVGLGVDGANNLYVAYSTATGAEPGFPGGPLYTPSEYSTLVVSYDASNAWRWQNDLSVFNPGAPLELHVNAVGDVAVSYRNGMTANSPGGGTPDGMAKLSSNGQPFWIARDREISAISLTDDGLFFACVGNYSNIPPMPWEPQLFRYAGLPDDVWLNLAPVFPHEFNKLVGDPDSVITGTIAATDPDGGPEPLRYWLEGDVPEGASIGAETGTFTWTPHTPGRYTFSVAASDGLDISTTELSVSVPVARPWVIRGTGRADTIEVTTENGDVIARVNGREMRRSLASITQITILARGGDDTISIGSDVSGVRIFGGSGDDSISGGGGADLIYGGNGKDSLNGGDGNDRLYGGRGNDIITGGDGGDDQLWGNQGRDTLRGNSIGDTLCGGMGVDRIEWDGAVGLILGRQDHDEEVVSPGSAPVIG